MEENYIVSARKYRPTTFSSVVGQKALTATLRNAIATNKLAHAYLFCGSRGVGKTSCARIFAKTINCEHPTSEGDPCNQCPSCLAFNEMRSMNIIELDAASNNGVEDIRSLVEQVQIPPTDGRYRVFIIDEVHMLSSAAFNAFLKTLEEPPQYVVFILATTEKHKIIPTILSRCQIYDFSRITIADMVDHLSYVAKNEGITADRRALNVIARKADGAMRDALSIFDQVAASSRGNITYQSAIDNLNVLDARYYSRLVDAFMAENVPDAMLIYKEIRDKGFDSLFFVNGLAGYLRDLMMARDPKTAAVLDADDEERRKMVEQASKLTPEFFYAAMALCNDADLQYRTATSKTFLVEVLLIKLCQLSGLSPISEGGGERLAMRPIEGATPTFTPEQQPVKAAASAPDASATPAPAPPAASASLAPAPPAPTAAGRTGRTRRSAMHISMRQAMADAPAKTDSPAPGDKDTPRRSTPFATDRLLKLWEQFAANHHGMHLLINTMRQGAPVRRSDDSFDFDVTVQNKGQIEELERFMPELLAYIHDALQNDLITFDLHIAESTMPTAWNDRELLRHIIDNNAYAAQFINDLKLSL